MIKNKVYIILLSICCLSLGICSCSRNTGKMQAESLNLSLSEEDTVNVVRLAGACMDSLKCGNLDAAVNMLHIVSNDALMPLSDEMVAKMRLKFQTFPVLDYKLQSLDFDMMKGNVVKYRVKFAEDEEGISGRSLYTTFLFAPVRMDKEWFLTVQ